MIRSNSRMIRPRGSGSYRGRPRSRSPIDQRPPMRTIRRSPSPGLRRNNGSYPPRFHRGGPPGFRGRGRGFRGMSSGGRDYGGSGAPYRPRRDDAPPYMHRDRERERSPFPPRRPFDRDYNQSRYGRSPPPRKFIDRGFGGGGMDRRGSPPPYYSRERPAPNIRRYSPNQGPPRRNYDQPQYHKSHREPGMGGYGPPRDGPGRSFDDRRRGPPPFERRRPPMERDYDGIPPYKRSRGPPDFHDDGNSPPSGGTKRGPPPFRDDRRTRSSDGSPSRDGSRR